MIKAPLRHGHACSRWHSSDVYVALEFELCMWEPEGDGCLKLAVFPCSQVDYAKAALFLNISSQPSEALPWWSHPELRTHKGLDPRTQVTLPLHISQVPLTIISFYTSYLGYNCTVY
jgi:hypothetical protein